MGFEVVGTNNAFHAACENVAVSFDAGENGARMVSDGFDAFGFLYFVEGVFLDLPNLES